ncbi:MAG: CpaD family pilus assembly protein [Rhodospirillales bacterium]|nr:CpaD family pilus assembly protein [Rhodospirillales bacterium]
MKTTIVRNYLIPLVATASFLLVGCQAPPDTADYRDSHQIEAVTESRSISFPDHDQTQSLSGTEQARFDQFMDIYHARGQGPVIIQASDAEGNAALKASRINAMRHLVERAGVAGKSISILPFNAENGAAVTLSFSANTVKVPECNNWESGSSYNWSNQRHSNFGCSYQRNLGLTIANPADINGAATMAPGDGPASASRIDGYRTGGGAATAAPAAGAAP